MQCIAYSPFVREFFTGLPNSQGGEVESGAAPYKYQVNPNNPMGHNGDFVLPFAETVAKMWDSGSIFSVYPWSFKGALGKVKEEF